MGWFRKSKKVEEEKVAEVIPESELTKNSVETEEVQVKSHEEILKDQYQNELDYLQSEIHTKTENLESISKKLASVKEEYDLAVTNLMKTKKELHERKNEIESMGKGHDEILVKIGKSKLELENIDKQFNQEKKKLEELDKVDTALAEVKEELEKNKTESESIKKQILQSQQVFDQVKVKQNEAEIELQNTYSKLKNTREEVQKLQAQKGQVSLSKNDSQFIQNELAPEDQSKNIVEAASAVVANMKHKLELAQKELEIIKKLLEKERKEHQETKSQLEEIKSKKPEE